MMNTNRNGKEIELLAALVERLRLDPHFMSHVLSTYQQRMGLDDEALACELGTPPEMIVRLALCKRPDVTSASYERDLRELSDYTLADEKALSQVIRRFWSLEGSIIPAASSLVNIRRPSRLWLSSAEGRVLAFTRRALTLACSVALLLIVGGVLLWRQSAPVAPAALVALGPGIDPPPADAPRASLADVTANASETRGAHNPLGDRSRGRRVASSQQLSNKTVIVDLDGRSTLREGEPGAQREKIIELPLSRTKLLLKLADGSSPGHYSVSIVDAFAEPVFSTKKSSSRGGILRTLVDTRGMAPGEYRLCVRRESKDLEVPDCFPLLILPACTDKPR